MTTTVVRASSSAAFLALVPRLLECTPRRSLVLVPFAEGRSIGALRVDLPQGHPQVELESIASTVIGMACKVAQTDAVAVAVYTDDEVADPAGLPSRAFVDAVLARAGICGLHVVDALVVGANGWNSYLSPTPARALSDIAHAEADAAGPRVADDQFAAAALPSVDPAVARDLAKLLADVDRVLGHAHDRARVGAARRRKADAIVTALADPPVLFEEVLRSGADELDPERLAAVAFCLERPALRDVALMQWAADIAVGDAVFDAQTTTRAGAPFPHDLAQPMWGEGPAPDAERLRRALELCRLIAASVPRERRPGALSACAWLAWAQGRSSHAGTYAQAAVDIDSAHGLSAIVLTMLDAGRLPEWVFERPTSRGGTGSSRGSRGR